MHGFHLIFRKVNVKFSRKQARLPVHDDCTSDSDDEDITKENKPSKKVVTNVKLQKKSTKHHTDRHTEYKVNRI